MNITINCGTNARFEEVIDLDDFGTKHDVNSSQHEIAIAYDMLSDLMNDKNFAEDHHRNFCAVNGCIALHVLGYNAKEWFDNWCGGQVHGRFWRSDLDKFMEHVERVYPYLGGWGPEGNEGNALNYAIV